uniref:Uncharacterized protein n=1 Tax=Mycoplasma feriruminatoris TaxID=1179777 RepID=A0A654IL97_9MOLU|nr:hypothetical protein MF5295_00671 [Mycoplasma feriruminatoris]
MFVDAYLYDMDLNNWNVSNVKNMKKMFRNTYFNAGNISDWKITSLKDMSEMFSTIWYSFNLDIKTKRVIRVKYHDPPRNELSYDVKWTAWDVSKVKRMKDLFNSTDTNLSLSSWDVSGIEDEYDFFPHYIAYWEINRGSWPSNTKGREPGFWDGGWGFSNLL